MIEVLMNPPNVEPCPSDCKNCLRTKPHDDYIVKNGNKYVAFSFTKTAPKEWIDMTIERAKKLL